MAEVRRDPRDIPSYGIREASHYLEIPLATLRSWFLGQAYVSEGSRRLFRAVLRLAGRQEHLLSFYNLVEAHVLDALRREHRIPLQKLRKALDYLARAMPSEHPLVERKFATDRIHLFVEEFGRLTDITRKGQLALTRVLDAYLHRLEWDEAGLAYRLYPFVRRRSPDEPRVVLIDPLISFGRPVLAGTGIPTAVISERYKAGDSIDELARDYERTRLEIEEAIRCELKAA